VLPGTTGNTEVKPAENRVDIYSIGMLGRRYITVLIAWAVVAQVVSGALPRQRLVLDLGCWAEECRHSGEDSAPASCCCAAHRCDELSGQQKDDERRTPPVERCTDASACECCVTLHVPGADSPGTRDRSAGSTRGLDSDAPVPVAPTWMMPLRRECGSRHEHAAGWPFLSIELLRQSARLLI